MWRTTCAAALATTTLLVGGDAWGAGGTVTDQAVSLTLAATHWSAAPSADLVGVDATGDPLFHTGWWYRIGGDTRETHFSAPSSELYLPGQIEANWWNLAGRGFDVTEQILLLDGEGPSGGFVSRIAVENNNATAAEVTLFHYLDPDLAASATGDVATPLAPRFVEFVDGASLLAYRADQPSHHQVGIGQALLGQLTDTAVTTLNDTSTPVGPGDATAAFQFGPVTLAPGQGRFFAVSALFNMPRRHVKGDTWGLGLATLLAKSAPGSPWAWGAKATRRQTQSVIAVYFAAPGGSTTWYPAGIDDFDGDYVDEIVGRDAATGAAMVGSDVVAGAPALASNWKLSATGDFNADGRADILWRNVTSQKLVIWTMNGATKVGNIIPSPDQAVDANWEVAAAADFNGDGHRDLLWYNQTSGKIVLWTMSAAAGRLSGQFTNPAAVGNNNWKALAVGDYGKGPGGVYDAQDIVWQNDTSKRVVIWYMDHAGNRTSGTFTTPDTLFDSWELLGPR